MVMHSIMVIHILHYADALHHGDALHCGNMLNHDDAPTPLMVIYSTMEGKVWWQNHNHIWASQESGI